MIIWIGFMGKYILVVVGLDELVFVKFLEYFREMYSGIEIVKSYIYKGVIFECFVVLILLIYYLSLSVRI